MSTKQTIVETEVQRTTTIMQSVGYQLKGNGWHGDYSPSSKEITIHLDREIDKQHSGNMYNYSSGVSFKLVEAIDLIRAIPEIVKAVLPLLMFDDKGHYASKHEPVELRKLNGSGAMSASILPAIEHDYDPSKF